MNQEISVLLYETMKDIVETYPVLADIEDSKDLPVPYAIYQLRETGSRTKEAVKKIYDVGDFLVTDSYGSAWDIIHKVEKKIDTWDHSKFCTSPVSGEVKYDRDDRCYIGEMSFTIKKL